MKPLSVGIVLVGAVLLVTLIFAAACGAPGPAATIAPPTQPPAPPATQSPLTAVPSVPTTAPTSAPTAVSLAPTTAPTSAPPAPTAAPTARPPAPSHPGLSLVNFATRFFVGSGNCSVCHTGISDGSGKDVSFDTQLRPSMMANSAKDPYWLAQVESEAERFPGLRSVIESKCVVCHMPMAHTEAAATGTVSGMLGNGFLSPNNPLHKAAMDGSSCSFCHQMQPTNFGKAESFTGGYVIDTTLAAPNRPAFGAFGDQRGQVMAASIGYTPQQGLHMTQSEMCATCHVLYTPYVDAQGSVAGEFPEQTPYLEWKHSDFGDGKGADMQCQECHMPAAQGNVPLAVVPRNLPARSPVRQHTFTGGNTLMLKTHQANVAELGLTASTAHLETALAETESLLQEKTAGISITDVKVVGDTLTLTVVVENKTGHKLPTSFPSRRAWIHLVTTDANGKFVFESGRPQADGSIAGCDADLDVKAHEPHYDAITSADQVQIYEPILGDTQNQVTYTLLRGAVYLKDNRLLPKGFDKSTANRDIAVYGGAADDANFANGLDQVTYSFSIAGFAGPVEVSAEILYQPIAYQFAEDLRGEHGPLATQFMRLWDAADRMPARVASARATVR